MEVKIFTVILIKQSQYWQYEKQEIYFNDLFLSDYEREKLQRRFVSTMLWFSTKMQFEFLFTKIQLQKGENFSAWLPLSAQYFYFAKINLLKDLSLKMMLRKNR